MSAIGKAITFVWHVVVTVVSFVVELVHAVEAPIFIALGTPLELFFMIPGLGPLARQVWNLAAEVVFRALGLVDALFGALGILPEKKLRIRVVILTDEYGRPVTTEGRVFQDLRAMIDLYHEQARVRVMPVEWVRFSTPFAGKETADRRFVTTADRPAPGAILHMDCTAVSWFKDVLYRGALIHYRIWKHCTWGMARRFVGYGSPLTVFVVRDIANAVGCSFGPLTDYVVVTMDAPDDKTIAHEIGHACGLSDSSKEGTLMGCPEGTCAPSLTRFQALVVRNSRHVTYF